MMVSKMSGMRVRWSLALLGLLTVTAWADDVKTVAAAVDAHYNHLRTLQTEFTEVYRGSGMERTESGTLWLKKPGKMRWEYRSPREKLFVSDGKDAWFYVPEDRQARKTAAKKLDDIRSPLAFLLGKTKLEKELRGLSLAPDAAAQTGEHGAARSAAGDGGPDQRDSAGGYGGPSDCADRDSGSGWIGDGISV